MIRLRALSLGWATGIVLSWIIPVLPAVLACFLITTADLIYGYLEAKRLRGECLDISKARRTFSKFGNECLLLLLAHLVEITIIHTDLLVTGIALIIAASELMSVLRHLNALYPGKVWGTLGRVLNLVAQRVTGTKLDENVSQHTDVHNKI